MASIQGIYIALFGRPADPLGLDYFNGETDEGANLDAITGLTGTAEYQDRFMGMNNVQIVTSIYQELFGRNPDAAGLAYFVAELNSGNQSIETIAINILDGAQGADAELVAAKEAAANQFTAAVRADADALARYQGENGIAFGQAFIDQVDSVDDEFTDAEVQAQVAAFGDGAGVPGTSINLTDAVGETVVGTGSDDTFAGVSDGTIAGSTFQVGDTVNGGAGQDTFNLILAGGTALPAGATVSNVEIVNINYAGGTLAALNSATFAGVQQLWQIDNDNAVVDFIDVTVAADVTAGFRSNGTAAVANDVDAASATQTTIAAAIDGVASGSAIDFDGAGLTTVSLSGSVFNAVGVETVTVTSTATNLGAVNVSLTGATTVVLGAGTAAAETINLGGSTGGITINLGAAVLDSLDVETLTGGTGADVLTVALDSFTAEAVTINGGAGNDSISIDVDNHQGAVTATALTVTGGAGADRFVLTTADDGNLVSVATVADLEDSLITVTDFDGAVDTFVLNSAEFGARAVQNDVNAAVDGAADLLAAATAASGVAGGYAVFEFGADLYIYADTNNGGFDSGDTLIKLTGVDLSDLTAANFVG